MPWSEPATVNQIVRLPPARETQQLEKLPAPFIRIVFVGQQRVKQVKFARIYTGIFVIRKKRRNCQNLLQVFVFRIKKWADGFRALPVFKR